MNCPLCVDVHLDVTHHGGIEVDICPRCRGIWLDRGELDRLVGDRPPDRSAATAPPAGSTGADRHGTPDRTGSDRSTAGRRDATPRKRRLAERLGDVLEEVLDL